MELLKGSLKGPERTLLPVLEISEYARRYPKVSNNLWMRTLNTMDALGLEERKFFNSLSGV